jgi:hypothetical protein
MVELSKAAKNKISLNVIARLDADGRLRLSSKDDPYKSDGMVIEVSRRTDAYDSLLASLGYEKTDREDSPEFILNTDEFTCNDPKRVPIGVDAYGFTVYWDIRYGSHLKVESRSARGPAGRTSMVKNILEHVRRNPETTEAYVFSPKSGEEYTEYDSVDNVSVYGLDYARVEEVSYSYYEKFEEILKSRQPKSNPQPVDNFKETFIVFDTNEGISRTAFKKLFIKGEDVGNRMMGDPYTSLSSIMSEGRQGKFSIISTSHSQEEYEDDYPSRHKPTKVYLEGVDPAKANRFYFGRIFDGTKSPAFKALLPNYSESL